MDRNCTKKHIRRSATGLNRSCLVPRWAILQMRISHPLSSLLIPTYPWLHISYIRSLRVELPTKKLTTSQPRRTVARDTSQASACTRVTCGRAYICVYACSQWSTASFPQEERYTKAQLYGQECRMDVTTFEVGGSSVRHFFMSFISVPSLLLFVSRLDCWLLVTPLPFPGYIFSKWFKDSLRNFCDTNHEGLGERRVMIRGDGDKKKKERKKQRSLPV